MRTHILRALLLLVAAVSLVACATPDSVVTGKIRAQMLTDETVRAANLNVDTQDGVVTVTGTVQTQETKDQAMRIIRETKGVLDVVDMISVRVSEHYGDAPEPERTVGERIDDAAITIRVKNQLLGDPVVVGTKIDVDTRDGVVYLTGSAKSQAVKAKAIELASRTRGVRNVQANIAVTNT